MIQLDELLTEERGQIPLGIGLIAEGLLRLLPYEVPVGWDMRDGEFLLPRLQGTKQVWLTEPLRVGHVLPPLNTGSLRIRLWIKSWNS